MNCVSTEGGSVSYVMSLKLIWPQKAFLFHGIFLSLEHLVQLMPQGTLFRKHRFEDYQYERYFRVDAQNLVPDTPRRERVGIL